MIKKRISILIILSVLIFTSLEVHAHTEDQLKPRKIQITAYYQGTTTYSGKPVREGYAAGKKEWIGKTAILYDKDMRYIGIFEIEDTGGDSRIKSGKCIDLYMIGKQNCKNFGRQEGYVQIVDAKG